MSLRKLDRAFYQKPAEQLARDLIGKILVHHVNGKQLRGRIVETEAYIGEHDLACHASKGRTKRTEVMFGDAGHAYVYFIYGMYEMLNIVASHVGDAQAVLVRAAEPLDDWDENLTGPGRLARGFEITRADNAADLTGDRLFMLDDGSPTPRITRSKRINIDYAGHWKHRLLRFHATHSEAVSGPKRKISHR
ncbi:MAG TPA: DNA-3-methyladenine glycosylase [Tepidisphaeraceae bacterium]|jgi:DNA-3-methyladenine glycosylase|nr:DNA-3-methyladenine glycosylase [Tepidisphaeraceae bacterium]